MQTSHTFTLRLRRYYLSLAALALALASFVYWTDLYAKLEMIVASVVIGLVASLAFAARNLALSYEVDGGGLTARTLFGQTKRINFADVIKYQHVVGNYEVIMVTSKRQTLGLNLSDYTDRDEFEGLLEERLRHLREASLAR